MGTALHLQRYILHRLWHHKFRMHLEGIHEIDLISAVQGIYRVFYALSTSLFNICK